MHVEADNFRPVAPSVLAAIQLGSFTLADWVERAKVAEPIGDEATPPRYSDPRQRAVLDRLLGDAASTPTLDEAAVRVDAELAAFRLGESDALAGNTMTPRYGEDRPNLANAYIDGYAHGTEYSG